MLSRPHQLHEIHQPTLTCDTAISRSRIDRVYSNHFLCDQLDRTYTCTAYPWTTLSAHRALTFGRRAPKHSDDTIRALPAAPMRHPDWARRVALCYHETITKDPKSENPARRLILLKRSIRQVTLSMQREGLIAEAAEADDQLGWTMSFVRAAEEVNITRMRRCVRAYPDLAKFIPADDPNARLHPTMPALREHAHQLAKNAIANELALLQQSRSDQNSAQYRVDKEHVLTRLKRTLPGTTTSISAMQTDSGDVTTDPAIIA